MKKIVLGIVGAGGRMGKIHTGNIKRFCPYVEVSSICDYDVDKISTMANYYNIKNVYSDYHDIINNKEINTVLICSSTPTHVDIIIECAKNKKNIFCEKPIDLNISRVVEAITAVKKANIKMQIGFHRRFDSDYINLKNFFEKKKIGKLYTLRVTSREAELPTQIYVKTSGGIFQDANSHDIDLVRFLTGTEIEEVYGIGEVLIEKYIGDEDDYDTAVIMLKLSDKSIATIEISRKTNYGYDQRIEAFGSGGVFIIDNIPSSNLIIGSDVGIIKDKPIIAKDFWCYGRYEKAYKREISSFFETLLKNKNIAPDGRDGLIQSIVSNSIRKSVINNLPVKIDYSLLHNFDSL